jgi:hypothetical protein
MKAILLLVMSVPIVASAPDPAPALRVVTDEAEAVLALLALQQQGK